MSRPRCRSTEEMARFPGFSSYRQSPGGPHSSTSSLFGKGPRDPDDWGAPDTPSACVETGA